MEETGGRSTRLVWIGSLLMLFFFAGCDHVPAARAAGVTLGQGEAPEFLYELCPGQRLEQVRLVNRVGDSPFDGDDDVLWKIVSEQGSEIDDLELGEVPSGFAEEVALVDDLEEYPDLVAVFESTTSGVGVAFDPEELRPDRVVTHDGSIRTREEFKEEAASRCP